MKTVDKMESFLKTLDPLDIKPKYKRYLKIVAKPMTGAGIVRILNETCLMLDKDKCYLEIGAHMGSSLLGAALGNKDRIFYGVDNFTGHNGRLKGFSSAEEGLKDMISRFGSWNVKYFNSCYKKFFENRTNIDGLKAQVYMYDADHMEENQYLGLKLAIPCLADDAIVFVDDSCEQDKGRVWHGIDRVMEEHPDNFEVIREFKNSEKNHTEGLWNGLAALRFSR